MSSSHQELAVRRSIRHDVVLSAKWSVAKEHEPAVKLSQAASRDGWVDCDVVDFGTGGAGLLTAVFVPRRALLLIRILAPGEGAPMLTARARVQRVVMTDRRPMYMLGTSFEEIDETARGEIDRLLERLLGPGAGGDGGVNA